MKQKPVVVFTPVFVGGNFCQRLLTDAGIIKNNAGIFFRRRRSGRQLSGKTQAFLFKAFFVFRISARNNVTIFNGFPAPLFPLKIMSDLPLKLFDIF